MFIRVASLYKNSFTGLSTQTWLLSLIMLINRSGTMVLPFMTLYLTSKEMNRTTPPSRYTVYGVMREETLLRHALC